MSNLQLLKPFRANPPDAADVVTWIHIGDLHMTVAGEQNHRDLVAIVDEINSAFTPSIAFVFIPGDVADDGNAAEYTVVRGALDALTAPWCSVVGDHDVHEKSFESFRSFMSQETQFAFQIGDIRFLALNAFQIPDPGSFAVLPDQRQWIERELDGLSKAHTAVLLLHCYPSDLKIGAPELKQLVDRSEVRLIDMGHTHYNEVANDGMTIYTATRSTGQIEEGPVGFSVTNIDGPVISWKFFPLGELPALMITSPADEHFITEQMGELLVAKDEIKVRAKVWSTSKVTEVNATLGEMTIHLANIPGGLVWEGRFRGDQLPPEGVHDLLVNIRDSDGRTAEDRIRCVFGKSAYQATERKEQDQDNPVEAWPERGLLGTAWSE